MGGSNAFSTVPQASAQRSARKKVNSKSEDALSLLLKRVPRHDARRPWPVLVKLLQQIPAAHQYFAAAQNGFRASSDGARYPAATQVLTNV